METLTKLFGSLVVFVYHCFDRIVINGYLSGLSRPEQVVYLFRDVVGVPVIEKTALSRRTEIYLNWVEAYASNHKLPIEWAEKGVRKDLFVPLAIIAVSLPLFLYWLRKVHSEIVNDKVILLHANRVAARVQMRYPQALESLQNEDAALPSEQLFRDLLDDWKVARSMIGKGRPPLTFRIAVLGFSTARFLYRASSALVLRQATRQALIVMATSVRYFAGVAGGRAAATH